MNVKLRSKKLTKGVIRYYLDIYQNGKRSYDFLDVKIYPSDSKMVKSDKINIAKLIRSNKEVELLAETTNYVPKHLKNVNGLATKSRTNFLRPMLHILSC